MRVRLTQEQIEFFDENGFLLLRDFAKAQLCDAIKAKAKEHIAAMQEPVETEQQYLRFHSKEPTLRRLRQVYDRDKVFATWMREKKIRPVLKQLLGHTPVLTLAHHNSIMTKMPTETSRTEWHQDMRYWDFQTDELISVWLALDSETLDNGVLEFIPGSHKMSFAPEQFDEKIRFREDLPQNRELIAKKVHYELNKGDVVLFHCKTLHAAGKNSTFEPKISFVYTVRAMGNKPLKNTRSAKYKEIILE